MEREVSGDKPYYVIQKIYSLAPAQLDPLVIASEQEGYHHITRLKEEYLSGTNRFALEGEALYGAYKGNRLIGICGLNQDPYFQDAAVGRIRRLYVLPGFRRMGVARQLVTAVICEAKRRYRALVLRTDNPQADLFYRSLGFEGQQGSNFTHVLRLDDE